MHQYLEYSIQLESLIKTLLGNPRNEEQRQQQVAFALDGEARTVLRRLIALDELRRVGAFFTPKELAELALLPIRETLKEDSVIADFACGAADLFLPCLQDNHSTPSLSQLLSSWGRQLVGNDVQGEFIAVAKRRLFLMALSSVSNNDVHEQVDIDALFPMLEVRNGLSNHEMMGKATHIVLNPPFVKVPAPADCEWASGKVNQAALFVETCVRHAKPGTRIVAILPDVLRSGTLYKKWRMKVAARTTELRSELYGQFDKWADVHVFVLELIVQDNTRNEHSTRWNRLGSVEVSTVASKFEVNVGSVVDYRDPHEGKQHPYLTTKHLPVWSILKDVALSRMFAGRLFTPPFVVVRRTSRQEDRYRAIGTVVATDGPVAVDNHLLVLTPRDGSLATCLLLLDNLKRSETSEWLNQRIRCRHLTVAALRDLPWWET